jgi:hypothetical protein
VGEPRAARARHGVWSCDADDAALAGAAPGFWEVYAGEPVTRTGVRIAGPAEARCHSWIATDPSSIERNRSRMYWRAAALLLRKLDELAALGFDELVRRATRDHALADAQDGPLRALPAPADAARLAARIVARQAAIQARYRVRFEQWVLLHALDSPGAPSLAAFEELTPPKDRAWADPHLLVRDGKLHLFIEEQPLDTRKGHISVLALEGGRWSAPLKVLETPYHLSNPFVFEHEGALYMVPESAANRTVDLYRCDRFPDRWTHVRTLFAGVRANDATLLAHGGRWWMFVNMNAHPGSSSHEELFLFHASDPVSGEWTPHPRNPVVSDVRRARPAGPVLVRNGVLIRPAQDCSVRYGYGMRFMRIARLDEADYEEVELARLEPRWDPRYVATHTFDQAGPVTVVDALRLRSRR